MVARMPSSRWISASLLVLLLSLHPAVHAFYLPGTFMHTYSPGEAISAKVNSLTSIETELPFSYYSLPYCKPPEGVKKSAENLGEILMGDQIDNSPYRFRVNVNESVYLCTTDPLTKEQAELLKKRARNLYQVNMILDNLPVMRFTEQNGVTIQWTGFPVGYNPTGSNEDYIINHLKFKVLVHQYQAQGDVVVTSEDGVAMVESDRKSGFQIVGFEVVPCSVRRDPEAMSKLKMYDKVDSVNCPLELEKSQAIHENDRITFTYEVEYVKSNINFFSRARVYVGC
jgi:transmembrane 9 superfamily protein 2/4